MLKMWTKICFLRKSVDKKQGADYNPIIKHAIDFKKLQKWSVQ